MDSQTIVEWCLSHLLYSIAAAIAIVILTTTAIWCIISKCRVKTAIKDRRDSYIVIYDNGEKPKSVHNQSSKSKFEKPSTKQSASKGVTAKLVDDFGQIFPKTSDFYPTSPQIPRDPSMISTTTQFYSIDGTPRFGDPNAEDTPGLIKKIGRAHV